MAPSSPLDLVVVGCGEIGSALTRLAAESDSCGSLSVVDRHPDRALALEARYPTAAAFPSIAEAVGRDSVVVIAAQRDQVTLAREALDAGGHVITLVERRDTAEELFGLGDTDRCVIVGAGLMPGVADVLVGALAAGMDQVSEVHLSRWGWAGPSSASEARRARLREARSGRELVWFPDPVGGRDCYLADHATSLTVGRLLPGVPIQVRLGAANRTDWLLRRRPGTVGLQVEVRGWRGKRFVVEVRGVAEQADEACAVVLLAAAERVAAHPLSGACGLAELDAPEAMLWLWAQRGIAIQELAPSN